MGLFSSVSLTGTFVSDDVLNSGVFGNALVSRGGVLTISAPGGALDSLNNNAGFILKLNGTATQFGFRMIDQINHDTTLQVFLGGIAQGAEIQYDPTGINFNEISTV